MFRKETMMSGQVTMNRVQWSERVRLLAVGVLAGATAGLVMGIGARIDMRIIALAAGLLPGFSAATFFILLLGLLLGIVPGMLYIAVKKYLPGSGLLKGGTFGLLWSLLIGLPIFLNPVSAESNFAIDPPLLGQSLFSALPIVYGVVLGLVEERLMRSVPAPNASRTSLCLYVVMAMLIALALFLVVATLIFHPSA